MLSDFRGVPVLIGILFLDVTRAAIALTELKYIQQGFSERCASDGHSFLKYFIMAWMADDDV